MKNKLIRILCFMLIVFISCDTKETQSPKQVESFKILIAKNIETVNATSLSNGYTNYLLAFNDGWTEKTSFGYYSCLQIGDTIQFVKDENEDDFWFEMKPVCK